MEEYIATFHTHLAALRTSRVLAREGVEVRMAPVPRKLSSSCGTCVRYRAEAPMLDAMDTDVEGVYRLEPGGGYTALHQNN